MPDLRRDKQTPERRVLTVPMEVRADDESSTGRTLVGYAARFDEVANIGGWFQEVIRRGAFARAIEEDDVRALLNHDPNFVLGRNVSGTLRMEEDEQGLRIEIDTPDTSFGRDLLTSVERGDINQMSFAFLPIKEARIDATEPNELPLREILEARLYDVSPVTYPAYDSTSLSVRAVFGHDELTEDEKAALRSGRWEVQEQEQEPAPEATRPSVQALRNRLALAERG